MIRRCGFPEMLKSMLASGFPKPTTATMHPDDYNDVLMFHNAQKSGPAEVANEFMGVKLYVSTRQDPGQWSFGYEGDDEQE